MPVDRSRRLNVSPGQRAATARLRIANAMGYKRGGKITTKKKGR